MQLRNLARFWFKISEVYCSSHLPVNILEHSNAAKEHEAPVVPEQHVFHRAGLSTADAARISI